MMRLKNRDITPKASTKNSPIPKEYDPMQLYEKYVQNLDSSKGKTGKDKKQKSNTEVRFGRDLRRDSAKSAGASAVIDVELARKKYRPKTVSAHKKPVIENIDEYRAQSGALPFGENEVNCFFDALKETVEEVFQEKMEGVVGTIQKLSKKVDDVSSNFQKIESTVAALCSELNDRIMYYGEEHSRHFGYICMKLEYDKLFYKHLNSLFDPEAIKAGQLNRQKHEIQTQTRTQTQSSQTKAPQSAPPAPPIVTGENPSCHPAGDIDVFPISQNNRYTHTISGQFLKTPPSTLGRSDANEHIDNLGLPETSRKTRGRQAVDSDCRSQLGIKDFLDTLKRIKSDVETKNTLSPVVEANAMGDSLCAKVDSISSYDSDDDNSSGCLISNTSVLSTDRPSIGAKNLK